LLASPSAAVKVQVTLLGRISGILGRCDKRTRLKSTHRYLSRPTGIRCWSTLDLGESHIPADLY